MMIGWEPDGCGWEGRSRGRVLQLRRPCHPKVRRLVLMVLRVFVPADLRQRVGAWRGRRSERKEGASLFRALKVVSSILKLILCLTGSQWRCRRTGVMCS